MNLFFKIFKYQIRNILRSKWLIVYAIFFLISSEALFNFSGDYSKAIVGLLNISMILIPVVSIIFGTIYIYNSREFIEMLLSHPLERKSIFTGIYLGMSIPLALSFVLGVGISIINHYDGNIALYATLLTSGFLQTMIFMSISITIAFKFNDKAAGIGVAIIIWIFFAIIYDALIMLFIWQFTDYPLEKPIIALTLCNPIDLARILVMLKFDAAALMGYTGAVFEKFFGSLQGIIIIITTMILWVILPFLYGLKVFNKKDF